MHRIFPADAVKERNSSSENLGTVFKVYRSVCMLLQGQHVPPSLSRRKLVLIKMKKWLLMNFQLSDQLQGKLWRSNSRI